MWTGPASVEHVAVRPPATSDVRGIAVERSSAQATEGTGGRSGEQAVSAERLDALTREVASQLRCVVCQGLSIEDSPAELAQEMKSVVREQLSAGRSAEEVKQYFVDTYGEWILLEPEPRGFNLAVYLLPLLALAGGAGIVVAAVRRWTRAPEDAAAGQGEGPSGRRELDGPERR